MEKSLFVAKVVKLLPKMYFTYSGPLFASILIEVLSSDNEQVQKMRVHIPYDENTEILQLKPGDEINFFAVAHHRENKIFLQNINTIHKKPINQPHSEISEWGE